MKGEYYRVVISNDKIKIHIFDKGNSFPYYSIDTNISTEEGREIIALFLQKFGVGVKEFKKILDKHNNKVKEEMKRENVFRKIQNL